MCVYLFFCFFFNFCIFFVNACQKIQKLKKFYKLIEIYKNNKKDKRIEHLKIGHSNDFVFAFQNGSKALGHVLHNLTIVNRLLT